MRGQGGEWGCRRGETLGGVGVPPCGWNKQNKVDTILSGLCCARVVDGQFGVALLVPQHRVGAMQQR